MNDAIATSSNHFCCGPHGFDLGRRCRRPAILPSWRHRLLHIVVDFGAATDVLTATLSILAITLTQMVLNRQKLREEDDRRRDVAMHAKLDELWRAEKHASKELAGIEELETEEIAALSSGYVSELKRRYYAPRAQLMLSIRANARFTDAISWTSNAAWPSSEASSSTSTASRRSRD